MPTSGADASTATATATGAASEEPPGRSGPAASSAAVVSTHAGTSAAGAEDRRRVSLEPETAPGPPAAGGALPLRRLMSCSNGFIGRGDDAGDEPAELRATPDAGDEPAELRATPKGERGLPSGGVQLRSGERRGGGRGVAPPLGSAAKGSPLSSSRSGSQIDDDDSAGEGGRAARSSSSWCCACIASSSGSDEIAVSRSEAMSASLGAMSGPCGGEEASPGRSTMYL